MLTRYPSGAKGAVWIDLFSPSDSERAEAERVVGHRLPTQAEISEIEWSSRVFIEDGALYLSTPVLDSIDPQRAALTTVGFVLSSKHLVTLRFASVSAFDKLFESHAAAGSFEPHHVFLEILESFVDHAADSFERASAELERVSRSAFRSERPRPWRLGRTSEALHAALLELGRMDDGISHMRDTLLGVDRITAFVLDGDGKQRLAGAGPQLQSLRADVASLKDYQVHLEGKVQFLLDATLGFINIQQNEIVKTLTIASVVGVPPVLIAGIYGMNFRVMPELGWTFGYPLALLAIVVSALVPLGWFKWRGWM
ncbi:MAG TPA: magnesium transporter CorA family protein [Polyangiaceae bacterium]|nr:magnesium transporter CorA family protein [Polyangiaceae bacterium]